MKDTPDGIIKRYPLFMFFVLAFAITWLILSPGILANLGLLEFNFDGTVLTILGGLGPLLAVIIVRSAAESSSSIKKIFQGAINWRVNIKWWGAAVLILVVLFGISALLNGLMGGPAPDLEQGVFLNGGNLIWVIALLLLGSFGEEPGWRGFALPKLQERWKPFKATLVLTLFWWLWHIPTYWTLPFAMNAREQYGFLAAFGIQFVVLLALGILCAWVFNGSGRSVLMPVLLHASWNFWSGAFGQDAATFLMPLFLLTATIVAIATRGKLGLPVVYQTLKGDQELK
ncbi:MAG: type II CAAX endopeptidase family protein [Anaerolineales bacterium]